MIKRLRVLIVEDVVGDALLVLPELRRGGFAPTYERVETPDAMRAALGNKAWDLIIADYTMRQFSAIAALEVLKESGLDLPFIIVSRCIGEDTAVAAMKAGAHDYLMKDNLKRLVPAIERELRDAGARRDRKKAEDALQASGREWRATFDAVSYAVAIMDLERRISRCNKAMANLVGKPFREIISRNCCELIHGASDPVEGCPVVRMCESHRREVLTFSRDGRWLNVIADPVFDESGNLIKAVHIMADITEQKRSEEALRGSEDRYRDLVEHSQDLICTHDLQGWFLSVNPATTKLLGYDQNALLNMNVHDILAPEVRDQFFSYLDTIRRDGVAKGLMLVRSATGDKRVVEYNNTLRTEGVASPIVRGVSHDVTERIRAEQALQKSEAKFRELYDNAPVGYHEYDAEGRITNVNDTDLEMLGYPREEMIGRFMWEFNAEGEMTKGQILEKLSGLRPPGQNLERSYLRKDGTTFPVLIEDRLILDQKGHIKGVRCSVQDITERKRAEERLRQTEEQLRQSQKMEAVGQLAGGIAHDFNNLLTIIKGYSQLSLTELKEDDPVRANVDEIKEAADRAGDLTRQLLAFSRRQVMEMKVIDLNTVLHNLEKMVRRIIGEDIELVTLLANDLERVKADPGQIEQVIVNLAVNAKDAMPSGGKLTIETANVELDEAYAHCHIAVTPGRFVMIAVSDTGAGMAPEVKARIFEPFFTTKEKGKGTGLGLSTVYGIVKQSGGNIWVYSEPGRGTTFKIYLPRVDEPLEELRKRVAGEALSRGNETVLVVEDEDEVRKLAVRILKRQGYTVLDASNGGEALIISREYKGPIHLMVTDVVMPGMGGRDLAERLSPLRPDMKVLYMSGYTDNAIVHHGILDEETEYLQKPFAIEGLLGRVREVLDK